MLGSEPADLCLGGREEVEGDIISNTLGSKQSCPLLQEGHYFGLPGLLENPSGYTGSYWVLKTSWTEILSSAPLLFPSSRVCKCAPFSVEFTNFI